LTSTIPFTPFSRAERYCIAGLSSLQALLFGWAAVVLPWQGWTLFALLAGLLALLHAATAISIFVAKKVAAMLWKAAALLASLLLVFVSWQVFTGAAYLAALYGALGEGLSAALLGIWGLFVLTTLPTSCWALVRTRNSQPLLGKLPWIGVAGLVLLLSGGSWAASAGAQAQSVADLTDAATQLSALKSLWQDLPSAPKATDGKAKKVTKLGAARCEVPPETSAVTLLATFVQRRDASYQSSCIQGARLPEVLELLRAQLQKNAARSSIKLDLITGTAQLGNGPAWTASLGLRAGLDGLCLGTRCWMPWQLLVRDAFLENRPLDFIPDLRFGVDVAKLQQQLASSASEDEDSAKPLRITTRSWLLSEHGLNELTRLRPLVKEVTEENLRRAASSAQAHIVQAQLSSGQFRYLLHPFSFAAQRKSFTLARQAGTLLVLCELGDTTATTKQTIERGLRLLAKHELSDRSAEIGGLALKRKSRVLELEDSALPLVAFLTCRDRVGSDFDALIARLTRLVLRVAREDGSFAPSYDLDARIALDGAEPLYAPGQSILALTLLERRLANNPGAFAVALDEIGALRRAAMEHVAHEHWPDSLYPFFFIEENWHCLAARAALSLKRNLEYEQFCLDYVAFKSRLILEEDSDVDNAFVGGLGFGNVIPPHNTGAAGFGEALAAAIAVKHARGQSVEAEQALLTKVLGFLQRQQWTEENCFGCTPDAIGAVSEHTHSPTTRIDFVQHAWAALGHGAEALRL
jgi:hypothetical protein